MKPFQIGLLVLVGALGGALIMRFTQRPKPAPAPIVSSAPAPVAAPAASAAPSAAAVEPEPPETKPSPVAESAEPAEPAPPVHAARRPKPVRQARPAVTVARNAPPPEAQPSNPMPAAAPVQEAAAPAPLESAPAPTVEPAPEPADQPAPQPAPSVTLQTGVLLPVRLGESLSSEHNQAGDTFTATLDAPLTAGGFVIAERGAHVEGRIIEAQKSTRAKGQAVLALELTQLKTSDGQHVTIQTEAFRKRPQSSTSQDVGIVAGAAGIGAIIGAIAGGGKGAGIGAAAGGAAGTGGVIATHAKAVLLPSETRISFRLKQPVTITEQMNR